MPVYDCRLNPIGDAFGLPAPVVPMPAEAFPRFGGEPGVLRDATGQALPWVIRCDTETGAVERYDVRDGEWQIDSATKRVVVLRETRPAPLTYAPE